jgi:hypothetical protein
MIIAICSVWCPCLDGFIQPHIFVLLRLIGVPFNSWFSLINELELLWLDNLFDGFLVINGLVL